MYFGYPNLNAPIAQAKVLLHVRELGAELGEVGQRLIFCLLHHVGCFSSGDDVKIDPV